MNIKGKNQNDQPATKTDLIILESKIESRIGQIQGDIEILKEKSDVVQEDINTMKVDINVMKDDVAKVLTFLYDHFPIQQHQVRENTDRIENHEVRIVKVEGTLDMLIN